MEFSTLHSTSAPHSSLPDSTFLLGLDFDWSPASIKSCNPKVNSGGSDWSPAHPVTQRPSASLNGAENQVKRMLYSAGEFQNNQRGESPVSCESSMIIEGMSRACRYSPEEKKERIERYRSKRSLRNFNKKIKYACRKSLADSRPRIRGRFARYNEEIGKNCPMSVQWSRGRVEEEEEEEEEANANANGEDNWINYFFDAYSQNLIP